jgi:uncharacterized membrane protein
MYLALKFVHVLAVIIFVGNITVGIFWKTIADATRDPRIIAHTIKGILGADRWFTIPAIIVLLIGGFGAAGVAHYPILGTGWILWGLGLFIIAGIAFGPVTRSQRRLLAIAQSAVSSGVMNWEEYEQGSRVWNIAGTIALITPLLAVAVMVLKPALPAF